jgi:hypothetical protein
MTTDQPPQADPPSTSLPSEVATWLASSAAAAGDPMPLSVGRAIDAIPDPTDAEIAAMLVQDRELADALVADLQTDRLLHETFALEPSYGRAEPPAAGHEPPLGPGPHGTRPPLGDPSW